MTTTRYWNLTAPLTDEGRYHAKLPDDIGTRDHMGDLTVDPFALTPGSAGWDALHKACTRHNIPWHPTAGIIVAPSNGEALMQLLREFLAEMSA